MKIDIAGINNSITSAIYLGDAPKSGNTKDETKVGSDTFQNHVEDATTYPSYTETEIVTQSTFSNFGDQYGYKLFDDIFQFMSGYHTGKASNQDVSAYFKTCCENMLDYRVQQGQTNGIDPKSKKKILTEMYEVFSNQNRTAALNINYKEGEKVNSTYQGNSLKNFSYYNSDYYYQCEEVHDLIKTATNDMTAQWNTSSIDLSEVDRTTIYRGNGGFDFNSGWNVTFRNNLGRSSIGDESMVPPKNFKFFYKEDVESDSTDLEKSLWGALNVTLGEEQISVDVPFASRYPNMVDQIFNSGTLLDNLIDHDEDKQKYSAFLNNIHVFTRMYSSSTKINDIRGNYTPTYGLSE